MRASLPSNGSKNKFTKPLIVIFQEIKVRLSEHGRIIQVNMRHGVGLRRSARIIGGV
ncbi:MAG: hypothetical protein ACI88A_004728 [Paraglaciecola sp.]|jgi:hypothetical protein